MAERLQKLLSQWGMASRRQAEAWIEAGRVRVNGEVAHLGQKADPTCDRLELDGRVLSPQNRPESYYLLLNKPAGVVSTCADPQGRPTVLDLLPPDLRQGSGIHPVGRLDVESTGALLLTNDGELTFQLTHPRHHVEKTYRVIVAGVPTAATLQRWQRGIVLSGRRTLPAEVRMLSIAKGHNACLEVVLREGRNRQIRRVAECLGHPVLELHRLAIATVTLGSLPPGKIRSLTNAEITSLRYSGKLLKLAKT